MTEAQREWLDNASRWGGSFVMAFANACYCADQDNFEILMPVLNRMMEKYPNYGKG